jgi:hypothetical protein
VKRLLLISAYIFVFCFVVSELVVRYLGYLPFSVSQLPLKIESLDGNPYKPDSVFFIALNDGKFVVKINNSCTHQVTHKQNKRVVSKSSGQDSKNIICFLGCSYTYGMGVDDSSVFCFLLSQRLNDYSVVNLAQPGLSNLHSLEILKKYIEESGVPQKVFFSLSGFHFSRNVLSMSYRKTLYNSFLSMKSKNDSIHEIPGFAYMDLKYKVQILSINELYNPFFFREYSALIYLFEDVRDFLFDYFKTERYMSINKHIIMEVITFCKGNSINLCFYDVYKNTNSQEITQLIKDQGFCFIETDIESGDKSFENAQCNDPHLNKTGHEKVAEMIYKHIIDE